jgi:nitroimidazol reductase NimA-like FMN-containing flavoprotein (pyridoxamine 5'-phosphate oxidase superfamily)
MIGTLNDKEIEAVLENNLLGRIGCHDKGRTYVVPISYVYDGKDVIAHSVPGMKIQMMRNNPQVCFEVDEMNDFNNWRSVIAWGEYQEITDPWERYRAIKCFVERTMEKRMSETATTSAAYEKTVNQVNARPVIYRIVILEKSGRFEAS